MIRTLPEASLIVDEVQRTVRMAAPVPFAILPVDQLVLDILPTANSPLVGFLIAEMLPDVEPSHDILRLHPPVEVVIHMACIEVGLMDHRTVRTQSLLRGLRHFPDNGFHTFQHIRIA